MHMILKTQYYRECLFFFISMRFLKQNMCDSGMLFFQDLLCVTVECLFFHLYVILETKYSVFEYEMLILSHIYVILETKNFLV